MSDDFQKQLEEADKKRVIEAGETELEQVDGVRIAEAKYTEERDLANQLLGQAQMANSFSKICALSALLKLRFVKENKLYRDIKAADGQPFTWEMYCGKLDISHKTVNEQLLNLNILGGEAFESLQQMGVGYRDLRKLRKLPEEDRQIIIESKAVDSGDKEAVLELVEDLVVKHTQEKEVLTQELENTKQTLEANAKVSAEKGRMMDELAERNIKLEGGLIPWEERVAQIKNEMGAVSNELDQGFAALVMMHDVILAMDFKREDQNDLARRSLVLRHKEVVDRAATLVAELQYKYATELCGYVGAAEDFTMQESDESTIADLEG